MAARTLTYPDRATVSLPPNTMGRVDRAAAADQRTRGEWLRRIVLRALESAERAERRRKAAS